MRCKACDCELTDSEATRKSLHTREYLDLCNTCLEPIKEFVFYTEGIESELADIGDKDVNSSTE